MNCNQIREELELSFGAEKLSDEIAAHLSQCEVCRAYQEQLVQLAVGLGDDEDIDLTSAEIERAIGAVEERLTPVITTQVTRLNRWRPVIRFAAAAMIVLVAYGSYEFGKTRQNGAINESELSVGTGYGSVTAFVQSDDVTEMDDNMVSVLIDEYSAGARIGADEALLGDITADEMQYLMENLKVGELL